MWLIGADLLEPLASSQLHIVACSRLLLQVPTTRNDLPELQLWPISLQNDVGRISIPSQRMVHHHIKLPRQGIAAGLHSL
jgi:hypothetical protein